MDPVHRRAAGGHGASGAGGRPDPAAVPGHVHERPALRAAHLRRHQEPHAAGEGRALPDECALPGLRRPAAAAGGAGRHLRRARHRRAGRAAARGAGRGARGRRGGRRRRRRGCCPATCWPGSSWSPTSAWATSSLDRAAPTLSAGELQRLRLATQLRSGLFGVVYVLDEPSAGLHPADTEALLGGARPAQGRRQHGLRGRARHRRGAAGGLAGRRGPAGRGARRAGAAQRAGGRAGRGAGVGDPALPVPDGGEPGAGTGAADADRLAAAARVERHNLRGLDAAFPLGVFTAVTGVSGSGKSTLVGQVLAGVLADRQARRRQAAGAARAVLRLGAAGWRRWTGWCRWTRGRSAGRPRSNLATYTGLFDAVRKLFARTEAARERGYRRGRFSFNVAAGRCETCQGEGFVAVECSSCRARTRPARPATARATTRRRSRSRSAG